MTRFKKIAAVAAIVAISQAGLFAQEKNEAIDAFNQGVGFIKADETLSAIASMESCVTLCEQIGDSANDLKEKAIKQIPGLYYKVAYKFYTVDKNMPECIKSCKTSVNISEKYSNEDLKGKSLDLMSKAYLSLGTGYFTSNENEKAINSFDSALTINPNYTKAILNKALTYKKMNDQIKFGETIDLFLSKVQNDTVQIAQANKMALDYYKNAGVKANQANKLTDAVDMLNKALKYGTDNDIYYQLANINNKQKNYSEGLANAQKGLDLETGAPEAKAKFYYELAVAQAGNGDAGAACETFKNANYPPFIEAVKAQRTNLKCK